MSTLKRFRRILSSDFYLRPTLDVARDLLGKVLVRNCKNGILSGRIIEVEAYHQHADEASHSFHGLTRRNAPMFEAGGILYVYFIYGMHFCMNVVTEEPGIGAAVLIRAMTPLEGIDAMRANRGGVVISRLTAGPAMCSQAFGIDRRHNGLALAGPDIMLLDAPPAPESRIVRTPRIGIKKSVELDWRFVLS